MTITRHSSGYSMRLTANDTRQWASHWPCSTVAGKRVTVWVDSNGLCDIEVKGASQPLDGHELQSLVSDNLPQDLRHLWPTWEAKQ